MRNELVKQGVPKKIAEGFIAYVNEAKNEEQRKKEKDQREGKNPGVQAVSANSSDELFQLFMKFWRLGIPINGEDAVIAGRNKVFVTYVGYKNKVISVYPEAEFDVQLVREGDEFAISKESGSIVYTHNIKNPFGDTQIIGAYAIIKTHRGEYFEALNPTDYAAMKSSSKMGWLWDKWASEFWLKSVIKRACKRHFNDIIKDIDKVDNDDYGLTEEAQQNNDVAEIEEEKKEVISSLQKAKTLDELKDLYVKSNFSNDVDVTKVKDEMKDKLTKKPAPKKKASTKKAKETK